MRPDVRLFPVVPAGRPPAAPDPGFAARPRLAALRDALRAAAVPRPGPRDAPVFFFDRGRQAELRAARPTPAPPEPHPLAARVAAELPALFASAEARRAARAVPGLADAARRLAPSVPAANDLADLLAVPDDEAVVVLDPAARAGYRLAVSGVADVAQFHLLLLDVLAAEGVIDPPPAARLVAAARDAAVTIPAGVPMTAAEQYQFLRPAALRPDGTLPGGFGGAAHWLWGHEPLAAVPLVDGERVVLLAEPAYRRTWEVTRRFPLLPAAVELDRVLGPFQVADRLARLTGTRVPVRRTAEARPARKLSRAA